MKYSLALVLILIPSMLFGAVDSIPVWQDTYMNSAAATTNYASNTSLSISNSLSDTRAWLKPNMSAASIGKMDHAIIDSVKLFMYKTGTTNGGTIYVYECLRDVVVTECTWNIYSTGNNWSTAGGQGGLDINTSAVLSTSNTLGEAGTGYKSAKLVEGPSGMDFFEEWVAGITPYGVVIGQPASGTAAFSSNEGANPPYFLVYYTPVFDDSVGNFTLGADSLLLGDDNPNYPVGSPITAWDSLIQVSWYVYNKDVNNDSMAAALYYYGASDSDRVALSDTICLDDVLEVGSHGWVHFDFTVALVPDSNYIVGLVETANNQQSYYFFDTSTTGVQLFIGSNVGLPDPAAWTYDEDRIMTFGAWGFAEVVAGATPLLRVSNGTPAVMVNDGTPDLAVDQ